MRDHGELMGDFRAFYCAGDAVRAHAFSYDGGALRACESTPQAPYFHATETAVPAPLPGYAASAFALLSYLPFRTAVIVWIAVELASTLAAAALLVRLSWASFDGAIVALAPLVGTIVVPAGELSPLALLGTCAVAYGVDRDLRALRVAGLALLAFEPQIALGVAATLLARKRTVVEAIAVGVALAALSFVAIGIDANLAYVRDFLPAHVGAELQRAQQYTLGWALAQGGVSTTMALLAARIAFACALVTAFVLARVRAGAVTIAAGAALAIAFGPFVHLNHVIALMPAAFAGGGVGTIAALLVALPPTLLLGEPLSVALVPVIAYWFLRSRDVSLRSAAYAALAATLAAAAFAIAALKLPLEFQTVTTASGWAAYVARHNVVRGAIVWIVKAPVYAGIALATASAALAARGQRRTRRNAR